MVIYCCHWNFKANSLCLLLRKTFSKKNITVIFVIHTLSSRLAPFPSIYLFGKQYFSVHSVHKCKQQCMDDGKHLTILITCFLQFPFIITLLFFEIWNFLFDHVKITKIFLQNYKIRKYKSLNIRQLWNTENTRITIMYNAYASNIWVRNCSTSLPSCKL